MTYMSPLKIAASRIINKRLEFRMNVAHGLASRSCTDNVFVKLLSESGVPGYGECVPRIYVTGETMESAATALRSLLSALSGVEYDSPEKVIAHLDELWLSDTGKKNPAAFCSLELALLDLAGKHWNTSVLNLLGLDIQKKSLFYSLIVPIFSPETTERFLSEAYGFGFHHVKIKVNNRNPVERALKVKSLMPPGTELRVDVNCSWTEKEAEEFIPALAQAGVTSAEQPLAAGDIEGSARLRGRGLLITLDESIVGPDDVDRAARAGACDIVNVRISKCGGLLGALRTIKAAERHGLGVQLGAGVGESCILSAAGAAIAAATPQFRWLEGCFGTRLLREDLCDENFQFGLNGKVTPPSGPGLGVIVNPKRLV